MIINAISVKEPWASRIAYGGKTIETRTWRAPRRAVGEWLLICASARPKSQVSGNAVAVARLAECRPGHDEDSQAAQCSCFGLWAWVLEDVRVFVPFPVKGRLGIFEVDVDERIFQYNRESGPVVEESPPGPYTMPFGYDGKKAKG